MGTIAGVVMDIGGDPIPDASVFVVSGPTHAEIAALTDEAGAYRLGGLGPGTYVLKVNADGFAPVSGRVPVRDGRVTRVNVTLRGDEVLEIEGSPDPEAEQGRAAAPQRSNRGSRQRARSGGPL